MTDYIPNDAQQKALDFLQEYPDEQEYTLQIPTGVGKSFLIMDKIYLNDRVMIVFPRLALLSQFYRDYISKYLSQRAVIAECTDQKDIKDTAKKDVDCYKSLSKKRTLKDEDEIIILTTYHSFSYAINKYEYLDTTIFDEAHHRSEAKIIEFLDNPTNKEKCGVIYNFSATCDEEVNEGVLFQYPFQEAIKNHLIRDFSVHVMICSQKNRKPKNPQHFVKQVERIAQLSKQKNPKYMAFSAFSTAEKENRSNVTEVVKEWSSFNEFWVKGITGNTKPNDREKIFKDFADHKGSFATLVSCRTLGEGIDIPNVNGAVFIDPRSSTREIIQIIGRALRLFRDSKGIPLPWEQQLPAIIVLPVYIDTDEYGSIDNDQDRDNFLRDAVENQEKGSFATVLNVASALREHNPEMSELCLFYPQGCPSKDIPEIRQYLGTQGYRIQEVPADGNCFFSCLAKAIPEKSAGDWRQEIIADLQERPFQEFGIDPESVKDLYIDSVWNNEAMDVVPEVAAEHLGRCIRVHHGDGRVDSFGSSDTSLAPIDLLLSDNHYSLLIPESDSKKSSRDAPQCSKEKPNTEKRAQPLKKKFHFHLDDDTRVLWKLRPDVLSRGLGELEHRIEKYDRDRENRVIEIVDRAEQRERNGETRIPKCIKKKYMTNDEKQEYKDYRYLYLLKLFLNGNEKDGIRSTDKMLSILDNGIPGWRLNKEQEAIKMANDIVQRCYERERKGGNRIPKSIIIRDTPEKQQEFKDSRKLKNWKGVLSGRIKGYCPKKVVDILDRDLFGWKDSLDDKALQIAKDIVGRIKERGGKLPIKYHDPKDTSKKLSDEDKQQQIDSTKLSDWRNSLEGKGSTRCPEEVIKYLDENVPGWRLKKDFELEAMELAKQIVKEANERKKKGLEFLPISRSKHGKKLQRWRNSLEGNDSSRCPKEVIKYLDENLPGWRLKKDFELEAMELAKQIVKEANERKKKGLEFLPISRSKHGKKLGAWKRELKDVEKLEQWRKNLKKYLDKNLPGWDDSLDDKAMQQAMDIIKRAEKRKTNGENFFPIGPRNPENENEKQQLLDKQKLHYWKSKNFKYCPTKVKEILDKKLPGWSNENKIISSVNIKLETELVSHKTSSTTSQDSSEQEDHDDDDAISSITTTAKEDEILDKDAEIQRLKKQIEALENQNKTGYKKGQYLAPNTESKKKINDILADHLPSKGLVIVLDHTDFGTASTLAKKDFNLHKRLLIPERNPEYFKKMKKDAKFGRNVRQEDMIDLLKRKNKESLALVYVDLMGSIKEAEPILDQLKQCEMVDGGVIAITISCRDGEEADYTNQFARKLTRACYKRWPSLHELTDNEDVLVYGEGVRMATMIFRV